MNERHKTIATVATIAVVTFGLIGSLAVAAPTAQAGSLTAEVQTQGTHHVTVETPTGEIKSVTATFNGTVEWENMPQQVAAIRVRVRQANPGAFETVLRKDYFLEETGTSGEYTFEGAQVDLAEAMGHDHYAVETEGESETFNVGYSVIVYAMNEGGERIDSVHPRTESITLTVKHVPREGGGDTPSPEPEPSITADVSVSVTAEPLVPVSNEPGGQYG